jgi:transcriptional regulator with XRE-family HTH domain
MTQLAVFDEKTMLMSTTIKSFRASRGLSQSAFAKSVGCSPAQISVMERAKTNRITPTMYKTLCDAGLDLKGLVPSLIIEQIRAKTVNFSKKSDLSVPLKRKDPIKLLCHARDLVKEANDLINSKFAKVDMEIEEHRKAIFEREKFKEGIIKEKQACLDNILSIV